MTLKEKKGKEISIELEFKVYFFFAYMYVVVQFYSWVSFLGIIMNDNRIKLNHNLKKYGVKCVLSFCLA